MFHWQKQFTFFSNSTFTKSTICDTITKLYCRLWCRISRTRGKLIRIIITFVQNNTTTSHMPKRLRIA